MRNRDRDRDRETKRTEQKQKRHVRYDDVNGRDYNNKNNKYQKKKGINNQTS